MKKNKFINLCLIGSSLFISNLNAITLEINKGWQLFGATTDINTTIFDNSCAEYIWSFDNNISDWSLYIPNKKNSSNYKTLDLIEKGRGYWIDSSTNCNLTIDETNTDLPSSIFTNFGVGFGSSSSFKFNSNTYGEYIYVQSVDLMLDSNISQNTTYTNIKDFNQTNFSNLQTYLSNSKYFTMWVTKGWKEFWYNVDKINTAIDNGKIPVFIYWYFGDQLVENMPTQNEIDAYETDNIKFKNFLDKIDGEKIVVFEPEFNKQTVLDDPYNFVAIISKAIDTIDSNTTYISLCMTDSGNRDENDTNNKCGYENCALGDKAEWSLVKPIYDALLYKLDFISFQEMLGQFSRDPQNPGTLDDPNPISYTDTQIGIDSLPKRLENISAYLYDTYKKPIYLPYITIATATWYDENDDNIIDSNEINKTGYEDKVSKFYSDINKTKLQENHLFGFSVMELFDTPDHDLNGYQYFLDNEYHLGIIKSSAQDGVNSGINGDIEFKGTILESLFKK